MAIKLDSRRKTYRSNVKSRKMNQNGLEAQYQGLDVREVNIDHAGLWMMGRGGNNSDARRKVVKVKRRYKVDLLEDVKPYLQFRLKPSFSNTVSLKELYVDTQSTISLRSYDGTEFTFQFSHDTNASTLSNGNIAVHIPSTGRDRYNRRLHFINLRAAIYAKFGTETFGVEIGPVYEEQTITVRRERKIVIPMGEMRITSMTPNTIGQLFFTGVGTTITSNWGSISDNHRWVYDGFTVQKDIPNCFYEDIRTDALTIRHFKEDYVGDGRTLGMLKGEQVSSGAVFAKGSTIYNLEGYLSGSHPVGALPASLDPTQRIYGETLESDEIIIEQLPMRDSLFNTYEDNFEWREDIHYIDPNEQLWGPMASKAEQFVGDSSSDWAPYNSRLERHIANMMDSNFVDEQYIEKNPLSARVDVFNRLKRHFGMNTESTKDRHRYSVLDQHLEIYKDFTNVNTNRYPFRSRTNGDLAFEDNQGYPDGKAKGFEETSQTEIMMDYFDQHTIDGFDYIEDERWTRIDDAMLAVLSDTAYDSNIEGQIHRIDRREWQQSDYIHTATGFVDSQVTGKDGIMYRDLKR